MGICDDGPLSRSAISKATELLLDGLDKFVAVLGGGWREFLDWKSVLIFRSAELVNWQQDPRMLSPARFTCIW